MPTVNAGAHSPLLFDYGGFPDYTYRLTWSAPGEPALASRVRDLLSAAGIRSAMEPTRGWDHGVFVPLKVMYPAADISLVQLSLQRNLDPAAYLTIGRALKSLREQGVLILGSGQSYHNMGGGFGRGTTDPAAEASDAWLREPMVDPVVRDDALLHWAAAPGARDAQPHEHHLLPLMVTAGAATGEPGAVHFQGHAFGEPISDFRFGWHGPGTSEPGTSIWPRRSWMSNSMPQRRNFHASPTLQATRARSPTSNSGTFFTATSIFRPTRQERPFLRRYYEALTARSALREHVMVSYDELRVSD